MRVSNLFTALCSLALSSVVLGFSLSTPSAFGINNNKKGQFYMSAVAAEPETDSQTVVDNIRCVSISFFNGSFHIDLHLLHSFSLFFFFFDTEILLLLLTSITEKLLWSMHSFVNLESFVMTLRQMKPVNV